MSFNLPGWVEKTRSGSKRIGVWGLLLSLGLSTAGPSAALTPAELLTPELERQPINLSGLHQGVLNFFDSERRLARRPTQDFVRLIFPAPPQDADPTDAALPTMLLELVDGQRLAGQWGGADRDGEAIVWLHPTLGQFTLGLDDVRRISRPDADDSPLSTPTQATLQDDQIVMANGDQLSGFVVGVDDGHVSILSGESEVEVALPIEKVRRLSLANPAADPGGENDLVALVDGSRVRGTGINIRGEQLGFTPALADELQPVEVELASVEHIDFAASGTRLIDLADLPMQVSGGQAFGLSMPPRWEDDELRLHAPVTVSFDLPPGAMRLSGWAELDLPVGLPYERRAWADMLLRVNPAQTGKSSVRLRFREKTPQASLNLAMDPNAQSLTFELDPAVNGPVLDRLRLRDAVLLLSVPDSRPGTGDVDR